MANTVKMNQQETTIQGLIGQYLAFRPETAPQTGHLDHDTLAAFVEGSLDRRAGENAVSHLVACSHCRQISAELIKLELEFADTAPAVVNAETAPSTISEVLSGLFSRIFGTSDGAVFAHTEDDEETKKDDSEATDENHDK